MKLTSLVVAAVKIGAGFGQNEKQAQRIDRMRRFWTLAENALIIPVGRILASAADATGKTVAEYLAAGEEIEMADLRIDGRILPLQAGFALSLKNLATSWGCPACRSAHGSGVYPSREVSAKLLADCKFYYRPSDRALFTISETCWKEYAAKLDPKHETRFQTAASASKALEALAKAVTTPSPVPTPATANVKGGK